MEPNSPKKIQFAVPLFQSHLDPQAAEHIRKRRPTPATLVIYNDPNASDDKQSASDQGENQLSSAQRKTSVYTPPTMRGKDHSGTKKSSQDEKHLDTLSEETSDQPSTGLIKGYSTAFLEDEEKFTEDRETQKE